MKTYLVKIEWEEKKRWCIPKQKYTYHLVRANDEHDAMSKLKLRYINDKYHIMIFETIN